jgi:hypothetical protein
MVDKLGQENKEPSPNLVAIIPFLVKTTDAVRKTIFVIKNCSLIVDTQGPI